ncbi:MAG: type III-B CRISPR module RAMP protein Cmr6 [Verrucomicrobia bacterium]|nr:type III-B CRISPR module RAMP protein Cmr6 [Verrucomicrobiota bacterium]
MRFLPAYPVNVSLAAPHEAPKELGELQLDVLASHHRQYYQRNPAYDGAPDTEDPNLVFFPTVAAGHVFVFTVLGRDTDSELVNSGRDWLLHGLEVFGVGAKTCSGYGWFLDVSTPVTPMLALQERVHPWIRRAESFAALPDAAKELMALELAAASELLPELAKQAPRVTKKLRDYCEQRASHLKEPTLGVLNRARGFGLLDPAAQETAGLELSDHAAHLLCAQPDFPCLLTPVLDWLRQNGLLPDSP